MAEQLVETDLYFESLVLIFIPKGLVLGSDKRRRLVWRGGTKDVSKRDILETLSLSVTVRKVDTRV